MLLLGILLASRPDGPQFRINSSVSRVEESNALAGSRDTVLGEEDVYLLFRHRRGRTVDQDRLTYGDASHEEEADTCY